jgi:hypothetical protein
MITVIYDGKNGLYRSEIDHYRHISSVRVFDWVEITIDVSQEISAWRFNWYANCQIFHNSENNND